MESVTLKGITYEQWSFLMNFINMEGLSLLNIKKLVSFYFEGICYFVYNSNPMSLNKCKNWVLDVQQLDLWCSIVKVLYKAYWEKNWKSSEKDGCLIFWQLYRKSAGKVMVSAFFEMYMDVIISTEHLQKG